MKKMSVLALLVVSCGGEPPTTIEQNGFESGLDRYAPGLEVIEYGEPILQPNAFSPIDDPSLVSVEIGEDTLAFEYDGEPSRVLEPGMVVAGVEGTAGYLRRLLTVERTTYSRYEATTEAAELQDFFYSASFRVLHVPEEEELLELWGELSSTVEEDEAAGRRTDALGGPSGRINLLGAGPLRCGATGSGSLTLTRSAALRPKIVLDHSITILDGVQLFELSVGFEFEAKAGYTGSVRTGVSCTLDVTKLFARVPSYPLPPTTFAIGPVPVVLTHELKPAGSITAELTGKAEVSDEVTLTFGAIAGVRYTADNGWENISRTLPHRVTSNFQYTRLGEELRSRFRVDVGIKYESKLYDLAGPTFTVGPFVESTFSIDHSQCRQLSQVDFGMAGKLGAVLQVPVIDYTLAEASWGFDIARITYDRTEERLEMCEEERPRRRRGGFDRPPLNPRDNPFDPPVDVPASDGGPPMDGGMPMDGGTMEDTRADPCGSLSACDECNRDASCGWCASTGACMSDSRASECGETDWRDNQSSCEPCDASDCTTCATSGFCGWCPGMGCLNLEMAGMCGGDIANNPGEC